LKTITILGLEKIGMVQSGDDLATSISEALTAEKIKIMDGDVIVVSQKVISKAEGLLVDISTIKPSTKAKLLSKRTRKDSRLIELILRDSPQLIRADRKALIVRRKNGSICLNAGVDKSNVKGRNIYSRLPADADDTADELRLGLEELSGCRLGVIIGDTYSRPFRVGQAEFAIGVSGIEPVIDYRGLKDLYGYKLRFKSVALADEIAAAAELVIGQGAERIPVAIIRGLTRLNPSDKHGLSKKLLLGRRIDLFKDMI